MTITDEQIIHLVNSGARNTAIIKEARRLNNKRSISKKLYGHIHRLANSICADTEEARSELARSRVVIATKLADEAAAAKLADEAAAAKPAETSAEEAAAKVAAAKARLNHHEQADGSATEAEQAAKDAAAKKADDSFSIKDILISAAILLAITFAVLYMTIPAFAAGVTMALASAQAAFFAAATAVVGALKIVGAFTLGVFNVSALSAGATAAIGGAVILSGLAIAALLIGAVVAVGMKIADSIKESNIEKAKAEARAQELAAAKERAAAVRAERRVALTYLRQTKQTGEFSPQVQQTRADRQARDAARTAPEADEPTFDIFADAPRP